MSIEYEVDWHILIFGTKLEENNMQLSYGYNVKKAVDVIDQYCRRHGDDCYRCPLRRVNPSGEYTCSVVHKKWFSAGYHKKKEHFDVDWNYRKQVLIDNGWTQVSFGPNVLWYKHRKYKEQRALKRCSDEEFFGILGVER